MNVYALDENYRVVTVGIPYDNLQWNRRYYTFGQFVMELPLSVYDPSWRYIGTPDRPELGMVQKVEITNPDTALISGFFAEKMLDNRAVYPPFNQYQDYIDVRNVMLMLIANYCSDMGIMVTGWDDMFDPNRVSVDTTDGQVGTTAYSLLETKGFTFSILYDFKRNMLTCVTWQGKDRSGSDPRNEEYIFSSILGNISSKTITTDDSDYYNYAIVPADADDDGKVREVIYVDLTNGEPRRDMVIDMRSSSVSDDQTMEMWREAVKQEATEQLLNHQRVLEIDIQPLSDNGYMVDYDLGDICSIEIPEYGYEGDARIVEVNEVFKADGGHELTLGFGNKRISNMRRAVNTR